MKEPYEIVREGEDTILRIDYSEEILPPSIEDNPTTMARALDLLRKVGDVTKIVFYQKRNYEYDFAQVQILREAAHLLNTFVKEGIVKHEHLQTARCQKFSDRWYTQLQNVLFHTYKSDPLGAFVELRRMVRDEKILLNKTYDEAEREAIEYFIKLLGYMLGKMDELQLIKMAKPYLVGYRLGDRTVYNRIFSSTIKPDFMFTKLMSNYPPDADELDSYTVNDTEVTIFDIPGSVKTLYHMLPPEFRLSEEKYSLLDLARKVMAEHKPKRQEFTDPSRMRTVFSNIGRDLLGELSEHKGMKLRQKELDQLNQILVRYTVGFGLIEVLLEDEKMQDVNINSPLGRNPIYIVHGDYHDCETNVIPTITEAESWASKLRLISGRPLDEANPILDTELELPGAMTRVSSITRPLDPTGIAFSFRRHRDKPWTLPLFIKNKMINPLAGGIISFLVDGTRSMLICGTRGSGKSSFLSSILIEIMRRYRILTVEDTLELPARPMRELGFNIQQMKVASSLTGKSTEMDASDGIRSTLRLGDSALIVGEVRSKEAIALYEAMRVGAAANVVAGTIHGDSPYGIFDRVVNDIGVPKTSFKATDICIIANPVKSADGIHKMRRVTQITEVRKDWTDDPNTEGGFSDLMKYEATTDQLEPSKELLNGDSEILKLIAANVREFAGNWDAVWDNIELRSKLKELQIQFADQMKKPELLEAPFTILCNDMFHKISADVKREVGGLDPKRVQFEWEQWIKRELKRRSIQE